MNPNFTRRHCATGALVMTLVLYFLSSITGGLYIFTDNITVGVVASGMYGDNNMCQYLHPLLCLIIKCLNPIMPTADVFATLTHAALLLGLFLMSYAVMEKAFQNPAMKWSIDEAVSNALLVLAIVYYVVGTKLFGANYTVQTSAIIAEGVIVLTYAAHCQKGKRWIAAGTILIFAGFLGRIEACLLFLPFLALELFTDFIKARNKRRWINKNWAYFLPATAVMFALVCSKMLFLRVEPYRSDAAYNQYRTITVDYPMETYGVSYKDFSEVDHSTYLMVTHWLLADTDRINEESLKKMVEAGSRYEYKYTKNGLKGALKEMKWQATRQDVHLMALLALTILLTLWAVLANRSIWLKLEALLCFLGGFIILYSFVIRGRALIRVWQCTLISALTILTIITIKGRMEEIADKKGHHSYSTAFFLIISAVLYFGIGQVIAHAELHRPTVPLVSRCGADDSAYEETFQDDALYLWPSWYSAIPDYFSKQDKLPTQRVIEHNIAMGDWVYGQVYFREFLQKIGAENPALALLERPNTYLMEGQEELFMQYMREHYGEDIQMEYVKEVNGEKAYRLFRR